MFYRLICLCHFKLELEFILLMAAKFLLYKICIVTLQNLRNSQFPNKFLELQILVVNSLKF